MSMWRLVHYGAIIPLGFRLTWVFLGESNCQLTPLWIYSSLSLTLLAHRSLFLDKDKQPVSQTPSTHVFIVQSTQIWIHCASRLQTRQLAWSRLTCVEWFVKKSLWLTKHDTESIYKLKSTQWQFENWSKKLFFL